jgi:prophage regulatory protein
MHRFQHEAPQSPPDSQVATFLRLPTVMRWTGLGRSTIYRMIAENKFPPPVLLAARAVAWRRTDLEKWSEMRPPATH